MRKARQAETAMRILSGLHRRACRPADEKTCLCPSRSFVLMLPSVASSETWQQSSQARVAHAAGRSSRNSCHGSGASHSRGP